MDSCVRLTASEATSLNETEWAPKTATRQDSTLSESSTKGLDANGIDSLAKAAEVSLRVHQVTPDHLKAEDRRSPMKHSNEPAYVPCNKNTLNADPKAGIRLVQQLPKRGVLREKAGGQTSPWHQSRQPFPRQQNFSNNNDSGVGLQHRNSTKTELSETMRSIKEIRQSLLDPTRRTNISPTTGDFIDHFVRKTDEEIIAITADFSNDLKESVSGDDNSQQLECQSVSEASTAQGPCNGETTSRSSHSMPNMPRKLSQKPVASSTRAFDVNLPKPLYSGSQAHSGNSVASKQAAGVTRTVNAKAFSAGAHERHRNVSSTCADNVAHTVHEPLQRNLTRIDINDLVQRMEPPAHNARGMSGSKWNSVREVAVADAEDLSASMECWVGDGLTPQGTDENSRSKIAQSVAKRIASSPTKISLMISQTHHDPDHASIPSRSRGTLRSNYGRRK